MRKLYIPKITDAQIIAATCCVRASFIRGTLRAKAIVAKDRMASVNVSQVLGVTMAYTYKLLQ